MCICGRGQVDGDPVGEGGLVHVRIMCVYMYYACIHIYIYTYMMDVCVYYMLML